MSNLDHLDQNLRESVMIEPMALQEEFVRLPADMAFWNERYSNAYQEFLQAKIITEQTRNRLWIAHKEHLDITTTRGKVTIADVEAAVVLDPLYIDAKTTEAICESEKVRLWGVMDSLRAKKEMLISLGAHIRMEMSNDPLIRRRSQIDTEFANQGR